MEDTGFPLFPHGVGGGAEEGAVVHGVLRCVAQATLSTIALGSLGRDPEHLIIQRVTRQVSLHDHTGTVIHHLVTPSQPCGSAFLVSQAQNSYKAASSIVWYCGGGGPLISALAVNYK